MCDENTFAATYRSDLRDEIVETLKDYADGITPTKQWCWDRYDDVELPVTGNDNGSWTCNASKSSENMHAANRRAPCRPWLRDSSSTRP